MIDPDMGHIGIRTNGENKERSYFLYLFIYFLKHKISNSGSGTDGTIGSATFGRFERISDKNVLDLYIYKPTLVDDFRSDG